MSLFSNISVFLLGHLLQHGGHLEIALQRRKYLFTESRQGNIHFPPVPPPRDSFHYLFFFAFYFFLYLIFFTSAPLSNNHLFFPVGYSLTPSPCTVKYIYLSGSGTEHGQSSASDSSPPSIAAAGCGLKSVTITKLDSPQDEKGRRIFYLRCLHGRINLNGFFLGGGGIIVMHNTYPRSCVNLAPLK